MGILENKKFIMFWIVLMAIVIMYNISYMIINGVSMGMIAATLLCFMSLLINKVNLKA